MIEKTKIMNFDFLKDFSYKTGVTDVDRKAARLKWYWGVTSAALKMTTRQKSPGKWHDVLNAYREGWYEVALGKNYRKNEQHFFNLRRASY